MEHLFLTDVQQNKIFNDRMASYCMSEYGFEVLDAKAWLLVLFAHKELVQDEDDNMTFVCEIHRLLTELEKNKEQL